MLSRQLRALGKRWDRTRPGNPRTEWGSLIKARGQGSATVLWSQNVEGTPPTKMIAAFCLLFLVAGIMAQKSPYLSSTNQEYPGLLNRFKPSASSTANGTGIGDRIGGPTSAPSPSSQGGVDGTLYDQETLDRVASWPVDKQPFWYKNRKQIAQHTGTSVSQQNATGQ